MPRHVREAVTEDDQYPPSKRTRSSIAHHHGRQSSRKRLSPENYTVAWVCALPIELAAAKAMLDDIHEPFSGGPGDSNTYTLGSIGSHNIVIACLPSGQYGTNNAAVVSSHLKRSFPSAQIGLMVGIGGGVPTKTDIRLGDVVVSNQIIQYDYGKLVNNGCFRRTSNPTRPPQAIMTAVAQLQAQHETEPSKVPTIVSEILDRHPFLRPFAFPVAATDRLFQSTYEHDPAVESCDFCDPFMLRSRSPRPSRDPKIHYGVVASSNKVIKHAGTRDLASDTDDVMCFEMEAAGLIDHFPCIVVRGICDYSDSHKSKEWQRYASATAAAYAKELLSVLHPPGRASPVDAEIGKNSAHPKPALSEKQREQLISSLGFLQLESRQLTIEHAHSDTCEWLLSKREYLDWLDADKRGVHHGFLWLKGKPGAGKSTLMKFILGHIQRTRSHGTIISFFFSARGDDLEKSTLGMYRSLLVQLFEKLPDLKSVLDSLRLSSLSNLRQHQWRVEVLNELFERIIQNLGDRHVICLIDALDECVEDQVRDMVSFFRRLGEFSVRHGVQFHALFSSRHYPRIRMKRVVELVLEGQHGHNEDMSRYIQSELEIGHSQLATEIRNELLRKASGVFMWVVLVVDLLNREYDYGRLHSLKRRLQEIPEDLHDLFRDVLTRDNHGEHKDELLLCIQCILFARRPLYPRELYCAIMSGVADEWDHTKLSYDDIERFILNSSKGLAETTKSSRPTVQFIHESVRDFFLKEDGLSSVFGNFGNLEGQGHDRLKQLCGKTLTLRDYIPMESVTPFLEYASQNMLHHAEKAAGTGILQNNFLREFPAERWILSGPNQFPRCADIWTSLDAAAEFMDNLGKAGMTNLLKTFYVERELQGPERRSLLTFAAECGLEETVKVVLKAGLIDPDAKDDGGNLAIILAAENGHGHVVQLLLHSGQANPNIQNEHGSSAISVAAKRGHASLVELLLGSHLIDPNTKDPRGRTPIMIAAEWGHTSVVELLLRSEKVCVNPGDQEGKADSPQTIISDGQSDVVGLLLESNLYSNYTDPVQVLLFDGIFLGQNNLIKLLLSSGRVDFDARDEEDQTPLHAAINAGREHIVKLFLESGQVDAKPTDGWTPVLMAVSGGWEDIVKLLLDSGQVDANAETKDGWTPLCLAIDNERGDIVKLLLDSGQVDVDAKNKDGFTPLCFAIMGRQHGIFQLLLDSGQIDLTRNERLSNTEDYSADLEDTAYLHLAILSRDCTILKLLLKTGYVDPNGKNSLGDTPLYQAIGQGDPEAVGLLLETGLVDPDSRDNEQTTPLALAALYGEHKIVRLLLETGRVDPDSRDNKGSTPLALAAARGNSKSVRLLLETGRVDPDSRDNKGSTPLALAAARRNSKSVRLLLETGRVDPDSSDSEQRTPLSLAAGWGPCKLDDKLGSVVEPSEMEDLIRLLLDTGWVNLESRDSAGMTPLHHAAANSNLVAMQQLIGSGQVNLGSRDGDGMTPFSLAVRRKHSDAMKLLTDAGYQPDSRDNYEDMTF